MCSKPIGRGARRPVCLLLLLAVVLVLPPIGHGADVHEARLANGMKVLVLENHKAPVAVCQVWYRAGARKESWGKSGLAHVFEHLMFKGTETVGPQAFVRRVEETGGSYNAFTGHDYAAYFEIVPSRHLGVVLELEADRMRHLTMTEEDFHTERQVVLEERRLRTEDQPEAYLRERFRAAAFTAQPYHWPIVGWEADLERLTLGDARRFYDRYYRPANAFLVVVGDVAREELMPRLENTFGLLPAGEAPPHYRYSDPPQRGERRLTVRRPARLPYLFMGYPVPNLNDPDSYALEVAAAVLSAGRSSRLHRVLVRERELALRAHASHPLLSVDPDLFTLAAKPRPGIDLDTMETALQEQVADLRETLVPADELAKAQNQLAADFVFAQDSLFYQGMLLAQHEMAGGWRKLGDYLPAVRAVRAEDVRRVARHYLTPERRVVGRLDPLPLDNADDVAQPPRREREMPPTPGLPRPQPYRPHPTTAYGRGLP